MTIAAIRKFAENTAKFDTQAAAAKVFDSAINKMRVINAVQAKLFNEGRAKDGRKLKTDLGRPIYAPYTVRVKRATNLPFKHVTLYQKGGFYASFRAVVTPEAFGIEHSGRVRSARIYENFMRFAANEDEFFEQALGLPRSHLEMAFKPPHGVDFLGGIKRIVRKDVLVVR